MSKLYSSQRATGRWLAATFGTSLIALALVVGSGDVWGARDADDALPRATLRRSFVVTQLPTVARRLETASDGMLRAPYGEAARLLLVLPDSSTRELSAGFHSACDPNVSFDATRILFAGKRTADDRWNVYEMAVDGSGVRQITRDLGDCRSPAYQSKLYTIVSSEPWYQLTFVGNAAGGLNEYGNTVATDLYSCKLDGSGVRRLTYNLSSDMDPYLMSDGRLLYASWQRRTLMRGQLGRVGLFGVNIDGADHALFAADQGRRIKHMPCATRGGLVVFVEADTVDFDGAGSLASVRLRRPRYSYRPLTSESDGLFHSPSPLPDGSLLVSRRPGDGSATHGVYRFDPTNGKLAPLFDDPRYHDIQAQVVAPRLEPDGRSSVVTEKDPHGRLYCLNVYLSDLERPTWTPGTAKSLRLLEGVRREAGEARASIHATGALAPRRVLGEIPLAEDGSFHVEIPASIPIELQLLDAQGMALRSCGWIWAKNHEPRGCIGCHEDGELTPENEFVRTFEQPTASLAPPVQKRRTVDFRRQVMPILIRKCVPCHRQPDTPLRLTDNPAPVEGPDGKARFNRSYQSLLTSNDNGEGGYGKYVHPGRARTSPLIWHIFGRNTSRPWDATAAAGEGVQRMPPAGSKPLSAAEKQTLVEWVDLGAPWDGGHGTQGLSGEQGSSAAPRPSGRQDSTERGEP